MSFLLSNQRQITALFKVIFSEDFDANGLGSVEHAACPISAGGRGPMKWIWILLIGVISHADSLWWLDPESVREPEGLAIYFHALNFEAQTKGAEYFYEVELESNYGTEEMHKRIQSQLKRAMDLRDQFQRGRIWGAPLNHWFPSVSGVDLVAKNEFGFDLESKISAMNRLGILNNELIASNSLSLRSKPVAAGQKIRWTEIPIKLHLDRLYAKFRLRELIEAASAVAPLPRQDAEAYEQPEEKGILSSVKVDLPTLVWNLRVYRKIPGDPAKMIFQGQQRTDMRPPPDPYDSLPIFADLIATGQHESGNGLRLLAVVDSINASSRVTLPFLRRLKSYHQENTLPLGRACRAVMTSLYRKQLQALEAEVL